MGGGFLTSALAAFFETGAVAVFPGIPPCQRAGILGLVGLGGINFVAADMVGQAAARKQSSTLGTRGGSEVRARVG